MYILKNKPNQVKYERTPFFFLCHLGLHIILTLHSFLVSKVTGVMGAGRYFRPVLFLHA